MHGVVTRVFETARHAAIEAKADAGAGGGSGGGRGDDHAEHVLHGG